ncbi:hypothetical protein O3P69_018516 [Scylla paramamosain]|uniref:Uncharacterized protein n=1 Tax=Scylla paramamosain TaxID=85552 RepID=A0AAW0T2L6_SCYPA
MGWERRVVFAIPAAAASHQLPAATHGPARPDAKVYKAARHHTLLINTLPGHLAAAYIEDTPSAPSPQRLCIPPRRGGTVRGSGPVPRRPPPLAQSFISP